ncbi:hypothetical protein [Runella sp.]|uniref:hypothetical protein n=1 Tax=Runella sp. TaxID=1960881 RepID=UPI003018BDB6
MIQTHWKKLHNPDYLGAYSLADTSGRYAEQIVTVSKIELKRVKGLNNKEEDCITCYFKEQPKPMILNATNCKALVKLSGSDFIENWSGLKVTLYVTKVKAFGDNIDALRIKAASQFVDKEELTPTHPKWEGAKKAILSGATTLELIEAKYKITDANRTLLTNNSV